MAQETEEVSPARAIVLDANILLRAVLGIRVRALIERYAEEVTLLTPQSCVAEAREYLPSLCMQRRWDVAPAMELLDSLLTAIHIVDNASLADAEEEAKQRIAARDPEDWPVLALAITLRAGVDRRSGFLRGRSGYVDDHECGTVSRERIVAVDQSRRLEEHKGF